MMAAVAMRSSRERLFQGNQDPRFLTKRYNVGHTDSGLISPRPSSHDPNEAGLRIRIHFIQIRIQHFRLNTDPDPIRIQGFHDLKSRKKITVENVFFYIKNYNLPIPRPP
jgi:hypothetical protein